MSGVVLAVGDVALVLAVLLMVAWFAVWPPMGGGVAGAVMGIAARVRGAGTMFRLDDNDMRDGAGNSETYDAIAAEYRKKRWWRKEDCRRKKDNGRVAAFCAAVALVYVVLSHSGLFGFLLPAPSVGRTVFIFAYTAGIAAALLVNKRDNRQNVPVDPLSPAMNGNLIGSLLFLIFFETLLDGLANALGVIPRLPPFSLLSEDGIICAILVYFTLFLSYFCTRKTDFKWELAPVLAVWGILWVAVQILAVYLFVTLQTPDNFYTLWRELLMTVAISVSFVVAFVIAFIKRR